MNFGRASVSRWKLKKCFIKSSRISKQLKFLTRESKRRLFRATKPLTLLILFISQFFSGRLRSETFGRVLTLDGVIQCTERDEFGYQELISQIPLCAHPNPERVLIVGGGDGGVAREVVKHPAVKQVHQVEIDGRVVELSKKYLPFMACGFESPKMNLTIGDGFDFMKNHQNEFDVIITDSSDPIGE